MADMCSFSRAMTSPGGIWLVMEVKPRMSQKSTVTSRSSPPSAASLLINCSATNRSATWERRRWYFWFIFSPTTISLKALPSWPISSLLLAGKATS